MDWVPKDQLSYQKENLSLKANYNMNIYLLPKLTYRFRDRSGTCFSQVVHILWNQISKLKNGTIKDVLYSMLGPDLLGLTAAVWNRALNVNFSIFCALLYHTSLRPSLLREGASDCGWSTMVKGGTSFLFTDSWRYQYLYQGDTPGVTPYLEIRSKVNNW